jgi:hypothetical protein
MALTKREIQKLRTQCNKLEDGPDYRMNDYVRNLLNTVLDFRINVATVESSMRHYEEHHGYRTHKNMKKFIEEYPNTKTGNKELAYSLWGNNHWTRAKFLRKFIIEFEKRGIKGQKSLQKWIANADFEEDIKSQFKTKEHSIGIALYQWLRLRLGIDTVKPDVHIVNFVATAVERKVTPKEALESLLIVAEQTERKASLLDAAIWHYQRESA